MDERDPKTEQLLRRVLNEETQKRGLDYHEFRSRNTGMSIWMDVHLLFPKSTPIETAHWQATEIEAAIKAQMPVPIVISTHLEPTELHDETHQALKSEKE